MVRSSQLALCCPIEHTRVFSLEVLQSSGFLTTGNCYRTTDLHEPVDYWFLQGISAQKAKEVAEKVHHFRQVLFSRGVLRTKRGGSTGMFYTAWNTAHSDIPVLQTRCIVPITQIDYRLYQETPGITVGLTQLEVHPSPCYAILTAEAWFTLQLVGWQGMRAVPILQGRYVYVDLFNDACWDSNTFRFWVNDALPLLSTEYKGQFTLRLESPNAEYVYRYERITGVPVYSSLEVQYAGKGVRGRLPERKLLTCAAAQQYCAWYAQKPPF